MPTAIAGLRGTGEFSTDFRPTNYRELFTLLEPNGSAPLQALLAMASSETTDDFKFNHFRDEVPARVLKINNGAGYNTSATALTVDADDDIQFAVIGAIVTNLATGEIMRATADASGTTLTVERNIGSTSYSITDNDDLAIVGFADKQGGSSPTPVSYDPTTDYNYTQIFKTSVSITGTMQKTFMRTGNKEQEMLMKALKLHMSDIERAMFFGKRHVANSSTAQPTAYTGGLLTQITNVTDVASAFATPNVMTELEFDQTLIESIFAWGGKEKVAFIGARAASNFMALAKNRWQPTQVAGAYGVNMTRYTTFAGDLLVYLHPMFRQIPTLDKSMVILDLPFLKYRYMDGRDTMLERDIEDNDFDGSKHQYVTECGLEMTQSKVHHVIQNWNATS
jgi:hypothetical protein